MNTSPSNSKAPGYFMLEGDQATRTAEGEEQVQFMTSENKTWSKVSDPSAKHYKAVGDLLAPHFPSLEVGACESLHTIDCAPSGHIALIEKLTSVFLSAGWVYSGTT